jgi:hypothetical protein
MSEKKGIETEVKLSQKDLATLIRETVVAAVQEMKRDPDKEAAKVEADKRKAQMQKEQEDVTAQVKAAQNRCAHKRENGDYVIAWSPYADNVPRGFCQRCNAAIDPSHSDYQFLLKHSTQGYTLTMAR